MVWGHVCLVRSDGPSPTAPPGAHGAPHTCWSAAVLELHLISVILSVVMQMTHSESFPVHLFETVRHIIRGVLKPRLGKTQRKVLFLKKTYRFIYLFFKRERERERERV